MIVIHPIENKFISAHTPNHIILGEVDTVANVTYTGTFIDEIKVKLPAIDGKVELILLDITKQIYSQINNYQDPFTYENDVTYGVNNNYHIGGLNIRVEDASGDTFFQELFVLNNSLQVNECITNAFYFDRRLGESCQAVELDLLPDGFNYFINQNMEGSETTSTTPTPTNNTKGLPIFEGYPHSTSILRPNGTIERILDYNGFDVPNLTYADGFIKNCTGIYLKWKNEQGGYSYWLFSNIFREQKKVRNLGTLVNHWTQRGYGGSNLITIGKESNNEMRIFSKIPNQYMKEVSSILESTEIYWYTDDAVECGKYTDNVCGWVRVSLENTTIPVSNTKYNCQEINLTINTGKRFLASLI